MYHQRNGGVSHLNQHAGPVTPQFSNKRKRADYQDKPPTEFMRVSEDVIKAVKSEQCYVLLDTNVFMQHLEDVIRLKYQPNLVVVVPTTVIQELDGLKREQENVGFTARVAIRSIYEALGEEAGWLRGQSFGEEVQGLSVSNNDDKILSAGLFYARNVGPTVLITGDFGLAVKCGFNGLPTTDMRGLLQLLPASQPIAAKRRKIVPVPVVPSDASLSIARPATTSVQIRPLQETKPTAASPISFDGAAIPGFCFVTPIASNQEPKIASVGKPLSYSFDALPGEVKTKVFSFLPPRSLLAAQGVSLEWYWLINQEDMWHRSIRSFFGVSISPSQNNNKSPFISNKAAMEEDEESSYIFDITKDSASATTTTESTYSPVRTSDNKPKVWYLNWRKNVLPPRK